LRDQELEPPMKKLSVIVALLALPSASALAADLQLPFKSPAGAFSWTGFYVGGNAGGAWGNERVSQTLAAPPPFSRSTPLPFHPQRRRHLNPAARPPAVRPAIIINGATGSSAVK
jgi:opacity protein-like surface antigen